MVDTVYERAGGHPKRLKSVFTERPTAASSGFVSGTNTVGNWLFNLILSKEKILAPLPQNIHYFQATDI